MKLYRKITYVAAMAIVFPGQLFAQGGPVKNQCSSEIEKFCADMEHGSGAIRSCLKDNKAQLSADCQKALNSSGGGNRSSITMLSKDEIKATLKEQDYSKIFEIEFESRKHYEVKALDSNGKRVELYVDGITGKIISSEVDD